MPEKRDTKRMNKRLAIRFGTDAPTRLAFTEDVSAHGLFIKTTNLCTPGTRIHIELTLPGDDAVFLEGMVRWTKKVPPQAIHLVKKSGLGRALKVVGQFVIRRQCARRRSGWERRTC